jgi:ParB family chromosome partitioning protein
MSGPKQTSRRGLGRGLDALLGSVEPGPETAAGEGESGKPSSAPKTHKGSPSSVPGDPIPPSGTQRVPIDAIQPNPYQPRKRFEDAALDELAASILEHGLIQPLLVTPAETGFTLIAGERRWQASRRAGLSEVPVVIRDATDQEMLALAIIENVQRADLDPIEAAAGYKQLMEEFGLTQVEVARLVGKSRSALANTIRLLGLATDVQSMVSEGHLSEGHARALLALSQAEDQFAMARQTIDERWSVRQTERAVRALHDAQDRKPTDARTKSSSSTPGVDPNTAAAITALEASLGTRVEIRRSGKGGQLVLHFYSEEELDALYKRLTR